MFQKTIKIKLFNLLAVATGQGKDKNREERNKLLLTGTPLPSVFPSYERRRSECAAEGSPQSQ